MTFMLRRYLIASQTSFQRCVGTLGYERLDQLLVSDEANSTELDYNDKTTDSKQARAKAIKSLNHFDSEPHLKTLKDHIPSKYFIPKRRLSLQHLYLLDKKIAKSVAAHVFPYLCANINQMVCETNAGLGLITSELLNSGIKSIRLYESCPEFRTLLKDFNVWYPGRTELIDRDLFHLSSFSYTDKRTHSNIVGKLLAGIPTRDWNKDPSITVVGPMANTTFINYLIRMVALQQEIVTLGRIQIFALIKPRDYFRLTATPDMGLHTYQIASVLFQLFFDSNLLDRYSGKSFLPWETKTKLDCYVPSHCKVDVDYVYLVRINFKRLLPVEPEHLLHLYYFIKQGFLKGKPKIIPTVEKWLPGLGIDLIAPHQEHKSKCFRNMTIFTEFGELNPFQILQIFLRMLEHPGYESSLFTCLVESELQKIETVDSDVDDLNTSNIKTGIVQKKC